MQRTQLVRRGTRSGSLAGLILTLTTVILLFASRTTSVASVQKQHAITPDHWAYVALSGWAERGLLAGYPTRALDAPASLTRFEVASLVLRAVQGAGQESARSGQVLAQLATPPQEPAEGESAVVAPTREQIEAVERGPGIYPEDIAMLEKLVAEFRIELAGMGTRVDDLEKLLDDARRRLQTVEGELRRHRVTGYVQVGLAADRAGPASTFSIRRARLTTSGTLSARASYSVQLQLEGDNGNRVSLGDAYVDLKTGHSSRLRTGQAVLPIGFEVPEADPDRIEVERSLLADRLFPDQRDIGLQWRYQQRATGPVYELALVNGSGANATDDNDRKDIIASVHAPLRWGSAALAVYNGKRGEHRRSLIAGGFDVARGETRLRGEVVAGSDRGADVRGWYARLSQRMTATGVAFVKHDAYDENTGRASDLFRRWSLGWSEQVDPSVRLTLQWETRSIGREFSDIADFRGDALLLQLQAAF